jgi:GNAT superfamily N-acetyltransferase
MESDIQNLEISGRTVTIRPISCADVEMEQEFVRRLSPDAKRKRFLGAVRELSADEARRFCDVDGHRSMAFVATVEENGRQRQIGVSSYAPAAEDSAREMAVTVADDWQHRGLGTRLAEALIRHARQHGVSSLRSTDLADNVDMRRLACELGMQAAPDAEDPRQVVYSLKLAALPPAAAS